MNYKLQVKTGFTLVELMVTTGIIILISAFMLPAFNGFEDRDELDNESVRLAQAIIQTRAYAQSPRAEKPSGADNYSIDINNSNNSFSIKEDGTAIEFGKISSDIAIDLGPGVPNLTITFYIANQGRPSAPASISLQSIKNHELKYIKIDGESGNIKTCDDAGC